MWWIVGILAYLAVGAFLAGVFKIRDPEIGITVFTLWPTVLLMYGAIRAADRIGEP